MTRLRHRWSPANRPSRHKSERSCARCGLIKVTRHEHAGSGGERHWTEWWVPVGGEGPPVRIDSDQTPACAPATPEETAT